MIQAVRGMKDILPPESAKWQKIESALSALVASYGYLEIRFPLIECTELFSRSVGEETDIVEKEMYTFLDRNGESLTLRPEGTAGCARAAIEHGLLYNQTQRLWYQGPLFRHERPQKGRYRQFHQFGVEAFGFIGPDIDIEVISLSAAIWKKLNLEKQVTLQINSLGNLDARTHYKKILTTYFKQHESLLDEDSRRRLNSNPLRILDSKNPMLQELINNSPKLINYLDPESIQHFELLCQGLDKLKIAYKINTNLVRGLDYYSRTVFEWTTDKLGTQSAVCAGGRYDGLVETIGGTPTPAVGFALGLERLIALLEIIYPDEKEEIIPSIYFVNLDNKAFAEALVLVEKLRESGYRVILHCGGGGLKNQLKKADKSGARFALILGEEELKSGSIIIKYLREAREQEKIALSECVNYLKRISP